MQPAVSRQFRRRGRLFVSQRQHFTGHILIKRTFLQEALQGSIHLAALPLHDMDYTQLTDTFEERLVFLVVNQKRQFFHSCNHASASFLFS